MPNAMAQVDAATKYIAKQWSVSPRVGIILGTGLGDFGERIDAAATIPFQQIPNFPSSTALGHRGQLICGTLSSVPVVAMQGRLHLYEGNSLQMATLPVRVMRAMGVNVLIVSNASGGLNPSFGSGELMIIEDHINLMWRNPLIGPNDDQQGPRFPDMCQPYDIDLMQRAHAVARANGIKLHQGVYAAMSGPTYETRAEYRMLRRIGADVVGMSTVPETIVAVHAGMRVLGLSAVTNLCRPDALDSTDGEQVKAAAELAEPQMRKIVEGVVAQL